MVIVAGQDVLAEIGWREADRDEAAAVAARWDASGDELRRLEAHIGDERAEIGFRRGRIAGLAGERVGADHRRARARLAGEAGGRVEGVEDQRGIGGLREALPREDAARLVWARTGGKAHFGQVR